MSKKRFTNGLDTLFEVKQETINRSPSISSATAPESLTAQPVVARRLTSKNFTSDLDTLFQDAFTEAVEEKLEKMRRTTGIQDPFDFQTLWSNVL